jgi:hypothetical protein
MHGLKTHFQQVPLEVAKKIAREEALRQEGVEVVTGGAYQEFQVADQFNADRKAGVKTRRRGGNGKRRVTIPKMADPSSGGSPRI